MITTQVARLSLIIFLMLALVCCSLLSAESPSNSKPAAGDPSKHAFPALGTVAQRKVRIEWNRYYDHAGLGTILAQLHEAFPDLTKLYSVGKSVEGRDLWCMELTSLKGGNPARKPAMYIDGNIHGNEVQAGEIVCYTAWYLCHQYGRLAEVTDVLDHNVFYLIPTINPDGRDRWFHRAQTMHSSRTGLRPYDSDRDAVADEDDVDDLDGDGSITQMRIKDPNGRWKPHPEYPDYLMAQAAPDERGQYSMLGEEGFDNDGDGKVNEDPAGGYDMNRNWAWDWQPNYIQWGSQDYPFSLPETRALSEFVISHPNIGAGQSFHNTGGMILRPPGREGGQMQPADDHVFRAIAERGERMLPYYRSMITWKDLYTVWGGETDWHYGARGIYSFVNELWTMRNMNKTGSEPSANDQVVFAKYVLLNDGAVKWHEFDHPTYGKIEVGGTKKEWGRTPPSFLLEEECHRNMAFTFYHAAQLPRLNISEVKVEKLQDNLYKVWVTVENQRLIPTRSAHDVQNKITSRDLISLSGDNVKVLSAGRVSDPYFKQVDPVKLRPERVEIDSITGLGTVRVQFIVAGSGKLKITVDSVRGGILETERALP